MLGVLALVVAAVFTGAAAYINLVEHPARMTLPDGAAMAEWKPAYKRATLMQASLAILGFLVGMAAWWSYGRDDWRWMAGGLAMLANWPYTLLFLMRLNYKLMAASEGVGAGQARALLTRWNRLHAGRTALGAIAVVLFTCAIVCP